MAFLEGTGFSGSRSLNASRAGRLSVTCYIGSIRTDGARSRVMRDKTGTGGRVVDVKSGGERVYNFS